MWWCWQGGGGGDGGEGGRREVGGVAALLELLDEAGNDLLKSMNQMSFIICIIVIHFDACKWNSILDIALQAVHRNNATMI